jgi:light-regulated signal transduction histidine kinase (bacteriophytochrome)
VQVRQRRDRWTRAGVGEVELPRLFTPFIRDQSRRRARNRWGLGLRLSRRIAEAHGGHGGAGREKGPHERATIPAATWAADPQWRRATAAHASGG